MSGLEDALDHPAWAVIRIRDCDTVTVLGGTRADLAELADIPLDLGVPGGGRRFDRLVLVPYAQIAERGFAAHQDGTPLSAITIAHEQEVPLPQLLAELPDVAVDFDDRGDFETDDQTYARTVETVIRDEIGNGAGANVVIARRYEAKTREWGHDQALTVLRRLLQRERGAYWTFCVFTGDRYLVGASPERHITVEAGNVRMNPISGTFRLRGHETRAARKAALLEFLADEKEIYELFMVVDEELKMMCDICHEGGLVLGPYLKPMSHLIHTEYLLAGRTSSSPIDVLRDSMFAATVTGSPVENACRLIHRYEGRGRGYYASVMALLGRDGEGNATADAPIIIRSADVSLDGRVTVTAGATLVRDSDPDYETAETHAKAGGILSAFGLVDTPASSDGSDADYTRDDDVLVALGSRNQRLSQFWLTDQSGVAQIEHLAGRHAVILDGEDAFVNMLQHVLGVLGMTSDVVGHEAWTPESFAGADLIIVGPGPGDPRDTEHPKIASFRRAVDQLLSVRTPFLAVCLGHQVLCSRLGFDLFYKDIVFQGTQDQLPLLGREELVGFYNTFVARVPESGVPDELAVEADPVTGDIHLIAGTHFRGVQFHAESILTQHGYEIVRDLVSALLPAGR